MKKDFDSIQVPGAALSTAAGAAVKESIERSGSRSAAPAGEAERLYRAETMTTRGRKGCKSPRINMAFTPTNHTFIKVMSQAAGMTMTNLVNKIIDEYRADHADMYEQLQKVVNDLSE